MAYQTEKEQIEIFARWWQENGTAVVIAVVLALAGYFGWTTWQKHQQTQRGSASEIYQKLLEEKEKSGSLASLTEQANELKTAYSDTFYGQAVRLLLAEEAVKVGNLEAARQELEAVVEKTPDETLLLTARIRLARVLYAQGQHDAALTHLQASVPDSYKALYAELRGDILAAQGKTADARKAYEEAMEPSKRTDEEDTQEPSRKPEDPTLEMKLNNLAAAS